MLNIESGKRPKISNSLFQTFVVLSKFCFLCNCFVKYLVGWQTV